MLHQTGGSSEPRDRGQVEIVIGSIEEQISCLEAEVTRLLNRTSCICRSAMPPPPESKADQVEQQLVPMANTLRVSLRRITILVNELGNLSERIEL